MRAEIRAAVFDVDGVLVGTKKGINLPNPSEVVSGELRGMNERGIPTSFLSGKSAFIIRDNVRASGVDGVHAADGGAVLFNRNEVLYQRALAPVVVNGIIEAVPARTYVQLFTPDGYYVEAAHQDNPITDSYTPIASRPPIFVRSFDEVIRNEPVTKVNLLSDTPDTKSGISTVLFEQQDVLSHAWSSHPALTGLEIAVVTSKGESKRSAVKKIAEYVGVDLENILGVGDTLHDWEFLEEVGYKGIMANATPELKAKIDPDDQNTVLGGHVNDDGVLVILRKFGLI